MKGVTDGMGKHLETVKKELGKNSKRITMDMVTYNVNNVHIDSVNTHSTPGTILGQRMR